MGTIVSVLMPVYNCEKYLRAAIESILHQTFNEFEFLIIDDCSSDSSWEIIKSYKDKRISIVRNKINKGASSTRNIGLKLSKGKYIALMDSDDISLPNRLKHQVNFMEANCDVGICGTWGEAFGAEKRIMRYPVKSDDIRVGLLFNNCFINTSVFMRSNFFKMHNLLFMPNIEPAEDYDLWVRCSELFKMANIPKALVRYRVHDRQASLLKENKQKVVTKYIRQKQIETLGIYASDKELSLFDRLACQESNDPIEHLIQLERWFFKLITANLIMNRYPEQPFKDYLATKYFVAHHYVFKHWFFVLSPWLNSIAVNNSEIVRKERLKFRSQGFVGLLNYLKDIYCYNNMSNK